MPENSAIQASQRSSEADCVATHKISGSNPLGNCETPLNSGPNSAAAAMSKPAGLVTLERDSKATLNYNERGAAYDRRRESSATARRPRLSDETSDSKGDAPSGGACGPARAATWPGLAGDVATGQAAPMRERPVAGAAPELPRLEDRAPCYATPASPIELQITNLDQNIDAREMKKILLTCFREHVMVLHVSMLVQTDGNLAASLRVPSCQDAQFAISQLQRKRIGSKRIIISYANQHQQSPELKRVNVVSLLQEVPGKRLPLFKFRELYERRFHETIGVSEMYMMKDIVTVSDNSTGRMVALQPRYRHVPLALPFPAEQLEQEGVPRFCPKHSCGPDNSIGWAERDNTVCLPNVSTSLKVLKETIPKLLDAHEGVLPMASLAECYVAVIGPIDEVSEGGVPLEHLVSCLPMVSIKTSPNGSKFITWSTNKVPHDDMEDLIRFVCPPLVGQLTLLSRELVDLLKTFPQTRLPFPRFIPAYHHHFGRQCRVADYGFTKLAELFDALTNVVQVLGEGSKRVITLAHRAQVRRFSCDLLRVLKSSPSKCVPLDQLSSHYEKIMGKAFAITDYGVNDIFDILGEISEATIEVVETNGVVSVRIPIREQTPEEYEKTLQFGAEVIELLRHSPECKMQFNRFIPAYHHHFGRQCKVADYGFTKLVELFEAIPDILEIYDDIEDGEKQLQLVETKRLRVLGEQVELLVRGAPQQTLTLGALSQLFVQYYGYGIRPYHYGHDDLPSLLRALPAHFTVVGEGADTEISAVDLAPHVAETIRTRDVLWEVASCSMPLDSFVEAYGLRHSVSPDLTLLTSVCPPVVTVRQEAGVDVVKLSPVHVFARDVHELLMAAGGRVTLAEFESAYAKRYGGPCRPARLGFASVVALLQSLPEVVAVRGRGSKKVLLLPPKESFDNHSVSDTSFCASQGTNCTFNTTADCLQSQGGMNCLVEYRRSSAAAFGNDVDLTTTFNCDANPEKNSMVKDDNNNEIEKGAFVLSSSSGAGYPTSAQNKPNDKVNNGQKVPVSVKSDPIFHSERNVPQSVSPKFRGKEFLVNSNGYGLSPTAQDEEDSVFLSPKELLAAGRSRSVPRSSGMNSTMQPPVPAFYFDYPFTEHERVFGPLRELSSEHDYTQWGSHSKPEIEKLLDPSLSKIGVEKLTPCLTRPLGSLAIGTRPKINESKINNVIAISTPNSVSGSVKTSYTNVSDVKGTSMETSDCKTQFLHGLPSQNLTKSAADAPHINGPFNRKNSPSPLTNLAKSQSHRQSEIPRILVNNAEHSSSYLSQNLNAVSNVPVIPNQQRHDSSSQNSNLTRNSKSFLNPKTIPHRRDKRQFSPTVFGSNNSSEMTTTRNDRSFTAPHGSRNYRNRQISTSSCLGDTSSTAGQQNANFSKNPLYTRDYQRNCKTDNRVKEPSGRTTTGRTGGIGGGKGDGGLGGSSYNPYRSSFSKHLRPQPNYSNFQPVSHNRAYCDTTTGEGEGSRTSTGGTYAPPSSGPVPIPPPAGHAAAFSPPTYDFQACLTDGSSVYVSVPQPYQSNLIIGSPGAGGGTSVMWGPIWAPPGQYPTVITSPISPAQYVIPSGLSVSWGSIAASPPTLGLPPPPLQHPPPPPPGGATISLHTLDQANQCGYRLASTDLNATLPLCPAPSTTLDPSQMMPQNQAHPSFTSVAPPPYMMPPSTPFLATHFDASSTQVISTTSEEVNASFQASTCVASNQVDVVSFGKDNNSDKLAQSGEVHPFLPTSDGLPESVAHDQMPYTVNLPSADINTDPFCIPDTSLAFSGESVMFPATHFQCNGFNTPTHSVSFTTPFSSELVPNLNYQPGFQFSPPSPSVASITPLLNPDLGVEISPSVTQATTFFPSTSSDPTTPAPFTAVSDHQLATPSGEINLLSAAPGTRPTRVFEVDIADTSAKSLVTETLSDGITENKGAQ